MVNGMIKHFIILVYYTLLITSTILYNQIIITNE